MYREEKEVIDQAHNKIEEEAEKTTDILKKMVAN